MRFIGCLLCLRQVHHALCEMLTEVLMPLVKANQPHASSDAVSPATLLEWYNQVLRMKNDIGQWVNKHTKHIPVRHCRTHGSWAAWSWVCAAAM
jgi:hypothetical protein